MCVCTVCVWNMRDEPERVLLSACWGLNNRVLTTRPWSTKQSHVFKSRPCSTQVVQCLSVGQGCVFEQAVSTGLPVVEGQDLERGGPASAGEVERAAGNRRAAGLHSAPARHRYADTHCRSLSLCLSVRSSSLWWLSTVGLCVRMFVCIMLYVCLW